MRSVIYSAITAVLLAAPAPAIAQDKLFPGLSEDETRFLNCVRACEAALDRCSEANRLELRRWFIDADENYRVPAEDVRAFFDCFRQRNRCLDRCDDQLPAG